MPTANDIKMHVHENTHPGTRTFVKEKKQKKKKVCYVGGLDLWEGVIPKAKLPAELARKVESGQSRSATDRDSMWLVESWKDCQALWSQNNVAA